MPIHVRRFADPVAFGETVTPFLVANEAENCLPLGLIATLSGGDSIYNGANYLAAIESDDDVIGATVMTPPYGPVISRIDDPAALRALVDDLLDRRDDVPTIFGPAASSREFAGLWAEATGTAIELALGERIFQLTRVIPPKPVSGAFREAGVRDRDQLARLIHAFYLEAFGPGAPHLGQEAEVVAARLGKGETGYALWEDGQVLAMAGYANPTPHGVVIGPVYTPPEFRGRGYASAVTAALSQDLLDRGRLCVFLFTNLENPISNHVYQKIGYQPVVDVDQWKFIEQG